MNEINLKFLKTKHRKVEGLLKEKKESQIIKNRIAGIKRHADRRAAKKEHYRNFAWWADFSGEQYYKNYSSTISGLFGQYTSVTNGQTGKKNNEY